jgi:hypothetical protein
MNMKKIILLPEVAYTFADYFKLNHDIDEILDHFGYGFQKQKYTLPRSNLQLQRLEDLLWRWEEGLLYIGLTSETARREFLIAPVLLEVVRYTQAKLRVEYSLYVNEQLKGTLDYLLQFQRLCVVIEANSADLERGFTQLAVELIALEQQMDSTSNLLYGAVSTGTFWQFGVLDREKKLIIQDFHFFQIPGDVEEVLRILIGILKT